MGSRRHYAILEVPGGLVGLGTFYAGIGTMNLVLGTLCVHLSIISRLRELIGGTDI